MRKPRIVLPEVYLDNAVSEAVTGPCRSWPALHRVENPFVHEDVVGKLIDIQ